MKVFITSDTHFGHTNILRYCPWRAEGIETIEEHDRRLVEAWNSVVGENDMVMHLGDFAMVPRVRLAEIRKTLNGTIFLALGNHDRSAKAMTEAGFLPKRSIEWLWSPTEQVHKVTMRHNPLDFTLEEMSRSVLLLHGHWHGDVSRHGGSLFPEEHRHKLRDVGVDARRSFAPAVLDDLLREMAA